MVALAAYVTRLYSPLTDLASTRVDVLTALVSFDRVFEVLDAPRVIADAPGAEPLPSRSQGRVEMDDVSFRYPAASTVSIASLEADGTALSLGRVGVGAQPRVVRGRARHHDGAGRPLRRRQDHPFQPAVAAVRRHLGIACASTATTSAT